MRLSKHPFGCKDPKILDKIHFAPPRYPGMIRFPPTLWFQPWFQPRDQCDGFLLAESHQPGSLQISDRKSRARCPQTEPTLRHAVQCLEFPFGYGRGSKLKRYGQPQLLVFGFICQGQFWYSYLSHSHMSGPPEHQIPR